MAFLGDFGKLFSPSKATQEPAYGLDPEARGSWDTLFQGAQQGIAPWQQAGFGQAMDQALTKFSGLNAARGGQNPLTLPQIASSASQYVLPQFAQLNTQMLSQLMGQRSRGGSGAQTGPGLGYSMLSGMSGGFGAGLANLFARNPNSPANTFNELPAVHGWGGFSGGKNQ